jgi:hypothetical protein
MLELSHPPIPIGGFMSRTRKQLLENLGQSGHHGVLRGSDFEALHDRIETKTGIGPARMSGGTFRKQVKAGLQPSPS